MSVIAEFTIRTPIIPGVLEAVPEMRLRNPDVYWDDDGAAKAMVWAWGGDFDRFEAALEAHDSVGDLELVTRVDGRRLYAVATVPGVREDLPYPLMVTHDVVVLEARGTPDGFEMRARFPSRSALIAYREGCAERDIPFRLRTLYSETGTGGEPDLSAESGPGAGTDINAPARTTAAGLTEVQRRTLRTAADLGYFEVPRGTTMDAIADELGVSTQAVSTRLRRGQQRLVQNVLDG
jgi:hypothetical protein